MRIFLGLLPMTFLLSACNYLDKPRPIIMRCTTEKQAYIGQLVEIFNRNGYTIVNSSKDSGTVTAVDKVENVAYRFTGLTRTWDIKHAGDSVVIYVWSVSYREDGSDVKQTWDKRYSGEDVKEWMRPIMVSLEAACGLGNPLAPRR
ncbi:MAG: hypothetical protein SGJ05_06635 [bacterium]|nr:hypothetical protein [bacterium]